MPKRLAMLSAFALLIAVASPAIAAGDNAQSRTISLSGTGKVNSAPDIAIISLGVTSEAKT